MSKVALVVDDATVIRRLVRKTLVEAGFEVLEASNGKEGLERLEDRGVDLVITDLNMPVMDGLDFIRALRRDPRHDLTPIVMLTADTEDVDGQGRVAGASGWIIKPFHPDKLRTVVQRLIP